MDERVKEALVKAAESEPFCQTMGIRLLKVDDWYALVEMEFDPERMNNIYARAHGGAIFSLIDEAFEISCQTDGTISVALNVNVTYVSSPDGPTVLRAESKMVAQTRKTTTFDIRVTDESGQLISVCQALAYNTGKPIPFL